jgi:GNAT superfamily N-acetyltransferase
VIRPATAGDARAIAEIQRRALARAHVDEQPPDLPVAEGTTLVAEVAGRIHGFATMAGGEIVALFVDPAAQGAGLGTRLHAAAEAQLQR